MRHDEPIFGDDPDDTDQTCEDCGSNVYDCVCVELDDPLEDTDVDDGDDL